MNNAETELLQIARDGQHIGQVDRATISQYISIGSLRESDYFWYDLGKEWRPLRELLSPARGTELQILPPLPMQRAEHITRAPELDPNEILWTGFPQTWIVTKLFATLLYAVSVIGIPFIPFIWMVKAHYRITRKRLFIETGIFRKNSSEVRIADIRNIKLVDKRFFLGTATLQFDVSGSNGVEIAFRNIPNPEQVRDFVRRLQD